MIEIANLLSTLSTALSTSLSKTLERSLANHTVWQLAVAAATYSASQLDIITILCFVDYELTALPFRKKIALVVLSLSLISPAQSLSL
jgi:hypothetical protein